MSSKYSATHGLNIICVSIINSQPFPLLIIHLSQHALYILCSALHVAHYTTLCLQQSTPVCMYQRCFPTVKCIMLCYNNSLNSHYSVGHSKAARSHPQVSPQCMIVTNTQIETLTLTTSVLGTSRISHDCSTLHTVQHCSVQQR